MVRKSEDNKTLQNKIHILFFSFLSFRLCLIIATRPAAEVTSAGPVGAGHLNVRSQIESSIFFSRAMQTGRHSGPSRCCIHLESRTSLSVTEVNAFDQLLILVMDKDWFRKVASSRGIHLSSVFAANPS